MHDITNAQRPAPDALLVEIADYVLSTGIDSPEAYDTARLCLMDSLGCMMLALNFPACTKLLGPIVPGAEMPPLTGVRVPGTMAVDAKQGGRILTSRGLENEAAWGRAAEWVDYRGPVEGQTAGITIFSMPDSFRPVCRWSARARSI